MKGKDSHIRDEHDGEKFLTLVSFLFFYIYIYKTQLHHLCDFIIKTEIRIRDHIRIMVGMLHVGRQTGSQYCLLDLESLTWKMFWGHPALDVREQGYSIATRKSIVNII